MNKKTRRNVLKGLVVSTPVAWTKPVVDSVVLPSHAQTSLCDVPADCYNTPGAVGGVQSITWTGGTGPSFVTLRNTANCTGGETEVRVVAVAPSAVAAAAIGCEGVLIEHTSPDLPTGCSFWQCPNN